MLTLTETAQELVSKIPDDPMFPSTAGLRIFRAGAAAGASLKVTATGEPRMGDKVLDYNGAHIFLGRRAVDAVKNKLLDARLDNGRVQFLLDHPA